MMSWVLAAVLLMATPAFSTIRRRPGGRIHGGQEPEDRYFARQSTVRRSTIYLDCPPRAVCAVRYEFNRTIGHRRIPERRTIYNCMCGDEQCPIRPSHRVHSSIRRREYLCQPVSRLPVCGRTSVAKEQVRGSEAYDFNSYFRVNCLCPRHTHPRRPKTDRGMELATEIWRVRQDFGRHMLFHERGCIWEED